MMSETPESRCSVTTDVFARSGPVPRSVHLCALFCTGGQQREAYDYARYGPHKAHYKREPANDA